ncbi:hypothetical protein QLQ12_43900 [Actinoplanes sp. NEAU-A12]|uniref:Uncharacterized protein n=1 Tax=Actinoplanes sandaracinus TaxID=3045177 RepID=A0ABT6X0M9_9ACTN|nr:hypothetical protein [Actinoplanes sandaracinus]MDI6105548.1 hypothetical protein [Actinoplanes sandaracinus]
MDSLLASALAEERLWDRTHAIVDLVPHLDSGHLDRVFALATEPSDEHCRQILIGELLPHLDARRLAAVTDLAVTRTRRSSRRRSGARAGGPPRRLGAGPRAGGRLIAHLSPDEGRQLLPVVTALDRNARAEVLPALTAVLPEVAPVALDALRHGRRTGRGPAGHPEPVRGGRVKCPCATIRL